MKFFYQLKVMNDSGDWNEIFSNIEEAETKKDLISRLENELDSRIVEKFNKKSVKNPDYKIFATELTPYWDKHWNEIRKCKVCSKSYTLLQSKQNDKYSNYDTCSVECHNTFRNKEYFNYDKKIDSDNAYIYRIYNKLTNKSYIGQSNNCFLKWGLHFLNPGESSFHNEVKNSNIQDWSFEILEVLNKNSDSKLIKSRQDYWIDRYDSKRNGYN